MKKGRFSKLILILIIMLNVAFTAYLLYILPQLSFEPSTLIGSWFGFWGGEAGLLALIKVFKVKKGGMQDEPENTTPKE